LIKRDRQHLMQAVATDVAEAEQHGIDGLPLGVEAPALGVG
jgi:hypothetical protein